MPIAPEIEQGAARQDWRAALCVLAFALGLLVLFHAAPRAAGFGVWGFQIAFAVAGYAVTRLMQDRFAEGRPWRAFRAVWVEVALWAVPATVLVIGAVLLVSVIILPPAETREQAWVALWTALSLGGPVLMGQGGYDPSFREELLLHGWALGVAAQLTLIWTVLLALTGKAGTPRWPVILCAAGMVVSFSLSVWLNTQDRALYAFFLAPARAWPFLTGALMALAGVSGRAAVLQNRTGALFAGLGAAALPIYLLTWPLLALPRMILSRPLHATELGGLVVLGVLLGLACHLWIERPLRRRLVGSDVSGLGVAGLGLFAVATAALAVVLADGFPARANARLNAEGAAVRPAPYPVVCNSEHTAAVPPAEACTTSPGPPARVIVWGDSHAAQLTPAVRAWAAGRGLAVRQATRSGCPALIRFSTGFAPRGCEAFNRAALAEWSRAPHADVILIGAGWTWALAGAGKGDAAGALEADVRATVRALRTATGPGTRIVLIGVAPDFAFAPARCHARRSLLGLDTARCDVAPAANADAALALDARLARVAASEPGVSLFRPWPVLCEGKLCRTRGADGPWFRDHTHLTLAGGLALDTALEAVLEQTADISQPVR